MSSDRTGMVFLPTDAEHAVDLLARADRAAVRRDVSRYVRVPAFARMLTEAGHRVADGAVTDDLLDDLAVIDA